MTETTPLISHGLENVSRVEDRRKTFLIITSVTLATGTISMVNGIVTVSLPTLATDLELGSDLLFWPASISALACGSTLLLFGSMADAVGARQMYIAGIILQTIFILGCGQSKNAWEMIFFRGLSGLSASCCLPSAVSIITGSFTDQRRDVAFACMGGGQPAGFVVGLVLGGIATNAVSWRVGFYISAAVTAITLPLTILGLATPYISLSWSHWWKRITEGIDWIGGIVSSTSLALLSHVLISITSDISRIRSSLTITLLSISAALMPIFVLWVGRRERLNKAALIPNSLWNNRVFTVVCITVFLSSGSVESLETILTFYFQDVQKHNALQSAFRFLPAAFVGILANVAVAYLVHRVSGNIIVVVSLLITSFASVVMAFATPISSYWTSAFIANLLNPVGVDALFTVENLLITSIFPTKTHGLAGGVFNTVSQIGKSVGLALVAVIATNVTLASDMDDKASPQALMAGYRAASWFCFSLIAATLVVAAWGLRGVGNVGHKQESNSLQ
ncbi:integral membrane protein [Myriangium duriaei CBS 260.36]|uniref:Integral membrane protein n=1 Tax=Myriangium duriaei CBS 260.36 TaxID=1168546 RepID=A0A9P4MI91_9PEZI|nr:integral membrane protein [Myriangium duriaei CBS 260.36]